MKWNSFWYRFCSTSSGAGGTLGLRRKWGGGGGGGGGLHSKQLLQGEHVHYSQSLLNLANYIFSPGFVSAVGVDHLPPPRQSSSTRWNTLGSPSLQ